MSSFEHILFEYRKREGAAENPYMEGSEGSF